MKTPQPFVQQSSNIYLQNKLLTALVAVIAISSIWDSIQIGSIRDSQQTILIPYGDVDPYEIRHHSANLAYVEDIAQYILFLYSNHSAANVRSRYDTLLSLFHSSTLPKYKSHLNSMADDYASYSNISHIATIERPSGIMVKENRIIIHYGQNRITGQKVQPPKNKKLIIDFIIENGRFNILEMSESLTEEIKEEEK